MEVHFSSHLALMFFCIFMAAVPLATVAQQFSGPEDTSVLRGNTAVLECRNPGHTDGLSRWSEGSDTFANENGVFSSADAKFSNFDVIASSPPITQLDLQINNAAVTDEGTYTCEITVGSGSATLKVEIEGQEPTITLDSGDPVISLEAGIESVLKCTASRFRPAVNLEWYQDDVNITAGISQDTPTDNGDNTTTSSGTLTFTPRREDDGTRLECRTTGQVVAPAKTGVLTLNVRFAPVVTVDYDGDEITCTSDANPLATSLQIILNGTDVLKSFTNSPGTADFKPDGCTDISCNATNTIATTTGTFADNPVCPVFPDETTTEMPTTGYVEPTMKPTATVPKSTDPTPGGQGGLDVGIIAAIAVVAVIIVLGLIIAILVCYKKRMLCFGANKTSNGGSSPKKQPSVINADMIRNQPEVRQSVHKYDDEPKKPRVPRSNSGKPAPEKQALNQGAPPRANDHQGYPMDSHDGDDQRVRGQAGVNYADLEFQNREGEKNGHGKIHQSPEEPTQYASILV